MGFLNAILLFGAAAAAIPLILHLLNRSRFQKIEWGAMHLLDDIDLRNSRRFEWQSLLLLLIRCAIPVLLALCMARPILTAMKLAGDGRASVVFLIDNSFSMQSPSLVSQRAETNFEAAKQVIDGVIDHWGRGSEFSLIPLVPTPAQTDLAANVDARSLRKQLADLPMASGKAAVELAFQQAKTTLDESSLRARQIVVISDFQHSDWRPESIIPGLQNLQPSTKVAWMPLGAGTIENIEVAIDANYSETVGKGEPLEVRVTLRNWGATSRDGLPVLLAVDQKQVAHKEVAVSGDATTQVSFTLAIEEPGQHSVSVRIIDQAPLTFDDVAELAVNVLDSHNVLVVRDHLEDSRYLETALQATQLGSSDSWLRVIRKRSNELNESIIGSASLVFLVNVPRLSDDAWRWIARRVEEGASLMIVPGEQCDWSWYNQLAKSAEGGYLPATFNPHLNSDLSSSGWQPVGFRQPPYAHPIFSLFNQPNHGRIDQVVIKRWYPLAPIPRNPSVGEVAQTEPETGRGESTLLRPVHATVLSTWGDVLISMNNGEPWLVSAKSGKGNVFQFATTLDSTSSNLPLRPVFVPLIHRLVCYSLAGSFEVRTQITPSESEPRFLSQAELTKLAADCHADVYSSGEDYAKSVLLQREGHEIWKWFLIALLVLLIGEVWFQRWLSLRGRR